MRQPTIEFPVDLGAITTLLPGESFPLTIGDGDLVASADVYIAIEHGDGRDDLFVVHVADVRTLTIANSESD